MTPNPSGTNPLPTGSMNGFGPTDAGCEGRLREWLLLGAAFTGLRIALVLQNEAGVWYRDSSGLTPRQMAGLEQAIAGGSLAPFEVVPPGEPGFTVAEALPLTEVNHRPLGYLCACAAGPYRLPPSHREGLVHVARHIQTLLQQQRRDQDLRGGSRSPSAASFVPGLVHELGSFIFGISANLDAFEARFAGLQEVSRHSSAIRRSLDRMGAFIEELREFGDPPQVTWTGCSLGPLLKGVVEEHREIAGRTRIGLDLAMEGGLPPVMADASSLRGAFGRMLGFMVQHAVPGGHIAVQVGTRVQGQRKVITGYLEGPSLPSADVDLSRLFEPFYFRTSGLGRLALPVARRILESHGGSLHAAPGPTGGIRIHFLLPAIQGRP